MRINEPKPIVARLVEKAIEEMGCIGLESPDGECRCSIYGFKGIMHCDGGCRRCVPFSCTSIELGDGTYTKVGDIVYHRFGREADIPLEVVRILGDERFVVKSVELGKKSECVASYFKSTPGRERYDVDGCRIA